MRCDPQALAILLRAGVPAVPATEEDWDTEYNALIISIAVVESLDAAIDFIDLHSSRHTDAIITRSLDSADRFLREVDSSSVMVNASTRFADGFEYGLGLRSAFQRIVCMLADLSGGRTDESEVHRA